jgi:hypothetical protein
MEQMVTFIGTFRIPDYDAWLPAIERMTEFVAANVPGARSFGAYARPDGTDGTVVYMHPNADSLDQHLTAAAALIEAGTEMVEVTSVQLLGAPNHATVERLRAAGVPVSVTPLVSGFVRDKDGFDVGRSLGRRRPRQRMP